MTVRTCFFDMGNVLVHFSHERMCRNIADLCRISPQQTRQFLFGEERQWQLERGEISEEEFHTQISEYCGRTIAIDDLRHAAASIFWLNDSIIPVLQELKAAGQRLVLLSNTSITHLRFIEKHFTVLQAMDERVTSFEAGALKPDRRIYDAGLAKANCPAEECFYTDDIPAYIDAARALGIQGFVYRTTDQLRADLQTVGALKQT